MTTHHNHRRAPTQKSACVGTAHRIDRRPSPGKPWLTDYCCDGGEWFRAANLYDAARKLQAQGVTGEATSYAANGTPSLHGTIERWAGLMVVERDIGTVSVKPYYAPPTRSSGAQDAFEGPGAVAGPPNTEPRPAPLTDAPAGEALQ